jgi:hypothetical protein
MPVEADSPEQWRQQDGKESVIIFGAPASSKATLQFGNTHVRQPPRRGWHSLAPKLAKPPDASQAPNEPVNPE